MSNEKPTPVTDKPAVEIKAPLLVEQTPAPQKPTSIVERVEQILEEAPADMFGKAQPAGSRPERVTICKAHITAFANVVGPGQTDTAAVQTAFIGLSNTMGLLETLNNADVAKVLDHLMTAINGIDGKPNKAFDKGYVFLGLDALPSTNDRERYVRMMNLFTTYAKLRDKSKLSSRVSVAYSLEHVKSDAGRKAITAYFS